MAKLSGKGPVVLALILTIITTGLIFSYLKSATTKVAAPGLPVIVAKVDIPPMTKITLDMVQETQIPGEYIQPGASTDINNVVGGMSRESIVAGSQVSDRLLIGNGKEGFSGIIPRDKRAVTVAMSEVIGVAGFVKAGDYVDVIATFDKNEYKNVSQIILQNILVLAINKDTSSSTHDSDKDKPESTQTTSLTLAVTPQEAVRLTQSEERGKLRLALRPYLPTDPIAMTKADTPESLAGGPTETPPGGVTSAPMMAPDAPAAPAAPAAPRQESAAAMPAIAPPMFMPIQVIRGTQVDLVPIAK